MRGLAIIGLLGLMGLSLWIFAALGRAIIRTVENDDDDWWGLVLLLGSCAALVGIDTVLDVVYAAMFSLSL